MLEHYQKKCIPKELFLSYMNPTENIKREGYYIFRSVLSKRLISNLKTIVEKQSYSPQAGFFDKKFLDSKAILNLQNKDPIFIKLLKNKLFSKINKNLLNDKYYKSLNPKLPNYILSQYAARATGKKKLVWHIDDKVPNNSSSPNYLQWAIPLVETNKFNGCTQLVPKSHLSGKLKPKISKKYKIKDIELKVGDVAVWDGRIWHSARGNKSNETRLVIIITFCKWFFKPHYDIARALPKKYYKKLDENLKIIFGFASITKLNEKSGVVQRGDLKSARNFMLNRVF